MKRLIYTLIVLLLFSCKQEYACVKEYGVPLKHEVFDITDNPNDCYCVEEVCRAVEL